MRYRGGWPGCNVNAAIDLVGIGGLISVIGANGSMSFPFRTAAAFVKGITFRIGVCSVQRH